MTTVETSAKGMSQSEIAEMWRTTPNPEPLADQIPNPEWEDLLRLDGTTGTLVHSGIRRLSDDMLSPEIDVHVGNACGLDQPWSRHVRAHAHIIPEEMSMCVRPRFVFNRAGKYSVSFLHEVAHILVGYTSTEDHGEVWHAVCEYLGDRVGRHALNHRLALAMGAVWSPEDEDYSDGASLGRIS